MAFTQDDKLIAIDTVLGKDVLLLAGIHGREALSQPYTYECTLLSPNLNIKPDAMLGTLASLHLGKPGADVRLEFSGFITSFSVGTRLSQPHDLRRYRALLEPWFALLRHTSDSRVFQDMTVVQIIEQVLKLDMDLFFPELQPVNMLNMAALKSVQDSYPVLEYCVQYNETDFNFVSRLMEEYGISYKFDMFAEGQRMVLFPDGSSLVGTAPEDFIEASADPDPFGRVYAWRHDTDLRAGGWAQSDYNFKTPDAFLTTFHSNIRLVPRANSALHFSYPGGYATRDVGDKLLTRFRIEEEETRIDLVQAESTITFLSPGRRVRPTNIATDQNTVFLVTMVDFLVGEGGYTDQSTSEVIIDMLQGSEAAALDQIKQNVTGAQPADLIGFDKLLKDLTPFGALTVGFLQSKWVRGNLGSFFRKAKIPVFSTLWDILFPSKPEVPYANKFHCLPDSTTYRPPRLAEKPRIAGAQTAIVVAAENEDIQIDEHGRVRVHFFWDRDTTRLSAGTTSCFIRVAQGWAGRNRGAQWFPRVGDEVVVTFLEGNPDRPIIVGSVYNGNNRTPFTLPDGRTLSGWLTHSTGTADDAKATNRYHLLRFDDAHGHEQLLARSQGRLDVTAKASRFETTEGDRHVLVAAGKDKSGRTAGGGSFTTTGGEYDLHVGGDFCGKVDKGYQLTVKGKTQLDLKADCSGVIGGKLSLNASEIVLDAAQKITLKVGSNSVVIMCGGVYIDGPMISKQCGGPAGSASSLDIVDVLDAAKADPGEPPATHASGGGHGGGPRGHHPVNPQPAPACTLDDQHKMCVDFSQCTSGSAPPPAPNQSKIPA